MAAPNHDSSDTPTSDSPDSRTDTWQETPLWYSVARSVFTHYWVFTLVVTAFVLWGVALAPEVDWHLAGLLVVAVALGLEGMHDVDLADPTVAVDIDPAVQRPIGYALIGAGTALGLYIASLTTWWVLSLVLVQLVGGFAYNAEWLDGLFHDLDQLGWLTAGLTLGFTPVVTGYYVIAQSVSLSVILWAVVAAVYSVGILHLYQAVKIPVLYEVVGVRTVRTMDLDEEETYDLVGTGLFGVLLATILSGVAFAVTAAGF